MIYLLIIIILLFSEKGISQTDKMYLPSDGGTTVTVLSGTPQAWYVNLEKYWYYRYRLVNDFLFIDDADGAGSSIPAQQRTQKNAGSWGDGYWGTLKYSDATIDLGHYIQMLATECQNLDDFGYSDTRTRYELQHALNAFDRLDDNAEQYEYQVSLNLGPNNGYPGTIASTPYGIQRNGYFIRDDVPFRTLLEPNNSIGTLYQHFNRPGLQRTWQYTGMVGGTDPDDEVDFCNSSFRQVWEGTIGPYTISPPNCMGCTNNCAGCTYTIGPFTEPSGAISGGYETWTPWTGAPRYPAQESMDQLIDIDLGMALVTHFCWDYSLEGQAANALYRTVNYPFSCAFEPQIHDPLDLHCVYGVDPTGWGTWGGCSTGGANYFGIAMGGAQVSKQYADPFGYSSEHMILQADASLLPLELWYLAQFSALLIHCNNSSYTDGFGAFYACLEKNTWDISPTGYFPILGFIPDTWPALRDISGASNWVFPQLPLIYQILYNPSSYPNWAAPQYENNLTAAPACGPYNFSGFVVGGNSPYVDTITENPAFVYWSGYDWISDPDKRWMSCYGFNTDPTSSGYTTEGATYNGLDYMVLFNLYSIRRGSAYLQGMNNPYYAENYNIEYPDNVGYGSNTYPLQLNFLEYANLTGYYWNNADVSIRVGASSGSAIDMSTGFGAQPACSVCKVDIYTNDYGCNDVPFNFASVLCTGCREAGSADTTKKDPKDDGYLNATNFVPIEYFPHGVHFTPYPSPPPDESLGLADSLITPEMQKEAFDSIVRLIIATGNDDAIDYIKNMGVNVDSFIQAFHITDEYNLIVSLLPNPTNAVTYLEYDLFENATVDVKLTNMLGQDLSNNIEYYDHNQQPGSCKIIIDADRLTPGFYVVTISINGHVFNKKLSVL